MLMDHVALSFEFFPPKTDEQRGLLHKSVPKLNIFAPEYVSVTFGAGGSTLDYTVDTVSTLKSQYGRHPRRNQTATRYLCPDGL